MECVQYRFQGIHFWRPKWIQFCSLKWRYAVSAVWVGFPPITFFLHLPLMLVLLLYFLSGSIMKCIIRFKFAASPKSFLRHRTVLNSIYRSCRTIWSGKKIFQGLPSNTSPEKRDITRRKSKEIPVGYLWWWDFQVRALEVHRDNCCREVRVLEQVETWEGWLLKAERAQTGIR